MTTFFGVIFELEEDSEANKDILRKILKKNFEKFISGIRQTEGLKIYFAEGSSLVIE